MATSSIPPILTTPAGTDLTENSQPRIIATSVVLIILTIIAVTLRILSRWVSQAGMWWDDWTIVAAMVLSWGPPVGMIVSTTHGFGKHIEALGPELPLRLAAATAWFKVFYAFETFYTFALFLSKISVLLFYSRIFKTRYFRIALWVTGGIVTAWFISIEASVLANCVPIHALWDFTPGAKCINLRAFFLGAGIPNILLNVIILILPLPMIWSLGIEPMQKLALSGVFLLGGFVVIVSVVRISVLAKIEQIDITWEFGAAGIWTAVEPCIAVVSACLPIMRSLWIRSRRSISTAHRSTTNHKRSIKSVLSSRGPKSSEATKDVASFTSRSHLNELSNEGELPWGNHVSIYATARRSEDQDIPLDDFTKRYSKRTRDHSTESHEKKVPSGGNGVSWLEDGKDGGSGKGSKKSSKESQRVIKGAAELPV